MAQFSDQKGPDMEAGYGAGPPPPHFAPPGGGAQHMGYPGGGMNMGNVQGRPNRPVTA